MIDQLKKDLQRDEGWRDRPYKDSVGKLTIGYGHNLDDKPIPHEVGDLLLDFDIADAIDDLSRNIPWWVQLPDDARRGLANMSFQLGWPKLSRFTKTLEHLRNGEYGKAADECLNSKWARQVPARANRVADLFRNAETGFMHKAMRWASRFTAR